MMEAVRTSETSVDNHFTRQYNPEDSSEEGYTDFKSKIKLMRFYVLTATSIMMAVFWDTAPCGLDKLPRDVYCFHHQGDCTRQHGVRSQKTDIFVR
jgi:hypothetical protein